MLDNQESDHHISFGFGITKLKDVPSLLQYSPRKIILHVASIYSYTMVLLDHTSVSQYYNFIFGGGFHNSKFGNIVVGQSRNNAVNKVAVFAIC
jgi:hypothetical protein